MAKRQPTAPAVARNEPGDELPTALAHLAPAIEASRSMLDLDDDWDGEGSPGYDVSTWRRAVGFLVGNARSVLDRHGITVPAPRIRKGPQGSVDLHWRTPDRELLINIPAATDAPADYYGDDGTGGRAVKGTLDPTEENAWLLMWLVR